MTPQLLAEAIKPIEVFGVCIPRGAQFKFWAAWCLGGAWTVKLGEGHLEITLFDDRIADADMRVLRELLPEEQHW
jgi:hypothetical protein